MNFSLQDRDGLLKLLKEETFDLVVVGGGVTGAGILRDAALRGLKAALVERDDFASGTSSRSSKLVHGGLRYLEQYNFGLVFESTHERAKLMDLAPHLVGPLPFMMPVYQSSRHGLFKMNMGMWLYDILASFKNYRNHRKLGKDDFLALEPDVKSDGLRGGMLYYDAMTDDARLTLETVLDGFACGGIPLNQVEARSVGMKDGHVQTLEVHDRVSDQTLEVRTRCIVCAAGPWTHEVMERLGTAGQVPRIRPTKGTHLVLKRESLPISHAVVMVAPQDGRVMFGIPWKGATVIGTTDTDHEGSADDIFADRADVDYLLASVDHYFPDAGVGIDDVIGTWSGLRPLIDEEGLSPSQVSREHLITTDDRGIVSIAGGKLTTYRLMAAETVRAVLKVLGKRPGATPTEQRPLPYSAGLSSQQDVLSLVETLQSDHSVSRDSAVQLISAYGGKADAILSEASARNASLLDPIHPSLPFLRLQAEHAARHEMALDLESFLCRRTPLFFLDGEQGLGVAPDVADLMGDVLGWDPERKKREIEGLTTLAGRHMAFAKTE